MVKITYKGETRDIPKKYIPNSLSPADRKKQIKSIFEEKERPKTKYKEKRSKWVIQFEKKYGTTIMDDKYIHKNIISRVGKDKILAKGAAAYYGGGSRPNQNATSWSRARLASVILGGPAQKIDKNIWEKYSK
tara:strand:- start:235 stop:633 length:399 start_codon:yes stop_codon:yes gene_type:complete